MAEDAAHQSFYFLLAQASTPTSTKAFLGGITNLP